MRRRVLARRPESWRAVPRRDIVLIPPGCSNETDRCVQMKLARWRSATAVGQPLGIGRDGLAALGLSADAALARRRRRAALRRADSAVALGGLVGVLVGVAERRLV